MSKNIDELLSTPETIAEFFDQKTRRNMFFEQILGSDAYTVNDSTSIGIPAIADNPFTLGPGTHAGIICKTEGDNYIGTSGTIIDSTIISSNITVSPAIFDQRIGSLTVLADSRYSNMRFSGVVQVGLLTGMAAVAPIITATFVNCIFDGPVQCTDQALFIGCLFTYQGAALTSLSGVLAPVFVSCCSNKSNQPFVVAAANQFGVTT